MAITNITWLQTASHSATAARQLLNSLVPYAGTIAGMDVTISSGLNVSISTGSVSVLSPSGSADGSYHVYNDGATILAIPANSTRYVAVQVRPANNDAIFIADTVAPTATPTPGKTYLARVVTGASTITSVTATGFRNVASTSNSMVPKMIRASMANRPSVGVTPGMMYFEEDTGVTFMMTKNWQYLSGDISAGNNIAEVISQTTAEKKQWKVDSANAAIRAGTVQGTILITYTGTTPLQIPTSGNLANHQFGTIQPLWRPMIGTRLQTVSAGPFFAGYLANTGASYLTARISTHDISPGDTFQLGWTCPARGLPVRTVN